MTESQTVSQIDIDRLVDGELDEQHERELLARLDQTPDGWRRCALAFLEARTWRRELRRLMEPAHRDRTRATPARPPQRARHAVRLAALCATWLVAFGLGAGSAWLTFLQQAESRSVSPRAVAVAERGKTASEQSAVVASRPDNQPTGERPSDAVRTNPSVKPDAADRSESVRLLVQHGSGQTEVVDVPVIDVLRADELWRLERDPAAERLRKRLERLGHRVRTQRWLIPVPLRDGRQLVVPVEELDVQPARFASYQ